jgi:hypothetical protein
MLIETGCLTSRVLKELSTDIAPILKIIYKRSSDTGDLPNIWKNANVSPIFKKGKRFEAVNYLPVLFSLPVNYLKDLRDFGLDKGGVDPFSPKYKLSSIICDVASFRLFKPVRSEPLHDNNRKFLHIPFANKGIDAINLSNIQSQVRGFLRYSSMLISCNASL